VSWTLDGSAHATLANNTALTIPDDQNWAFAGWCKYASTAGTNYPRVFCWGTKGARPHVQVFLAQADNAVANADRLCARIIDNVGVDSTVLYAAGKAASDMNGEWVAWTLTYDAAANRVYFRVLDRALSTFYSDEVAMTCHGITSVSVGANLYLGSSSALGNDRWVGDLSETCYFNGTFMEVNNFHGFIHGARGHRWPTTNWYTPMLGGRYEEWTQGLTVTNTSITAGDSEPQLTMFTPRGQPSLFSSDASYGLGRIAGGNVLGA